MANPVLPKVALDQLKCTNCNRYISVGPVKVIPKGFLCGRCPTEGHELLTVNIIYEKLAQYNIFPCCYDALGCKQTFPFGEEMKIHEMSCSHRSNLCPMGFLQNCQWHGLYKDILEHLRKTHPSSVLENLNMKINVQAKTEKRYIIFASKDFMLVMDVFYHAEKGLSVEVMQFTTGVKNTLITYDILLRPCNKISPTVTFTRAVSKYTFAINAFRTPDDIIRTNQLQCVDKNEVIVSIVLKWHNISVTEKTSVMDRTVCCACKNFQFGCRFIGNESNIAKHEKSCIFIECPMKSKDCVWRGKKYQLYSHCRNHGDVRDSYKFKLSELISSKKTVHFYLIRSMLIKYVGCPDGFLYRVGILFDVSKQLMYISAHNVGPAPAEHLNYMTVNFHTVVGSTLVRKIVRKPLTTDESAFDNCPCFSYEHLLNSTVEFK